MFDERPYSDPEPTEQPSEGLFDWFLPKERPYQVPTLTWPVSVTLDVFVPQFSPEAHIAVGQPVQVAIPQGAARYKVRFEPCSPNPPNHVDVRVGAVPVGLDRPANGQVPDGTHLELRPTWWAFDAVEPLTIRSGLVVEFTPP